MDVIIIMFIFINVLGLTLCFAGNSYAIHSSLFYRFSISKFGFTYFQGFFSLNMQLFIMVVSGCTFTRTNFYQPSSS